MGIFMNGDPQNGWFVLENLFKHIGWFRRTSILGNLHTHTHIYIYIHIDSHSYLFHFQIHIYIHIHILSCSNPLVFQPSTIIFSPLKHIKRGRATGARDVSRRRRLQDLEDENDFMAKKRDPGVHNVLVPYGFSRFFLRRSPEKLGEDPPGTLGKYKWYCATMFFLVSRRLVSLRLYANDGEVETDHGWDCWKNWANDWMADMSW